MGRPLRAVYANSTYSTGVQEMSDSDISDLITPVILNYVILNPDVSYGTRLRTASSTYDVSRGSATDIRNDAVGAHPASNTTINTYNVYQSERAQTVSLTSRPVHYIMSGNEVQVKTMSDQDMYDYLYPVVVNFMLTGGQGAYYLGLTSSGTPTGTWTTYATLNDTYYSGATLITDQYTLWQRTDAASVGTIRPLKSTVYGTGVTNRFEEMSDADIEAIALYIGEYIRTTGIGQYAFQTTSPGSGTWVNRGSFANKTNDLVDTGYLGNIDHSFTGTFTGIYTGTFTGAYSSVYNQTFTGAYLGSYNQAFTGAYSTVYSGAYSSSYTGGYAGGYVTAYSGVYNNTFTAAYTRAYTGNYTGLYTGYYTGSYAGTYVNYRVDPTPYLGNPYTGEMVGPAAYYTGYYTGYYAGSYAGTYAGTFVGSYNRTFTSAYTAAYAGTYSTTYTGLYTGIYTSAYTGGYTSAYTGSYVGAFTGSYSGAYTGNFTGIYTGAYSSLFTGAYNNSFTGAFTGNFTGLTVQSSTTSATTTLWVRTA